jgi:ABC-type multidrug transport system fused ATPase/permease subunit
MNENEIGPGLVKLEGLRSADDDRNLARKVLQRDRGRVWLLTGLAVLFWTIAGAGVLFVAYVAIFHIYPKQQQLMHDHAIGKLPTELFIEIQALHFRSVENCTLVVAAAFIAATLAAICTLLLILVSRRATLRQINANLVEIFEKLQQQPLGPAQVAPGFDKTTQE